MLRSQSQPLESLAVGKTEFYKKQWGEEERATHCCPMGQVVRYQLTETGEGNRSSTTALLNARAVSQPLCIK